MISIKALGMYSSDFSGSETRNGDTQIVTDGKYYDVIDGGCDRYATRLIAHLKANNIRDPYLHISHPHHDHRDGINKILSDTWFTPRALYCQDPDSITGHNSSIRSDINALKAIIAKAEKRKSRSYSLITRIRSNTATLRSLCTGITRSTQETPTHTLMTARSVTGSRSSAISPLAMQGCGVHTHTTSIP